MLANCFFLPMGSGLMHKDHNPALIRVIESNSEKRLALENKFNVSTEAEFKKPSNAFY